MSDRGVESSGRAEIHPDRSERGLRSAARWVLGVGFLILVSHAVVPLEEFVHRGDDAYYYFQIAVNYAEHGFWTFDGIHPTNGVQPLWGMILSGSAVVLRAVGVTDPQLTARCFVLLTAFVYFGFCAMLFRLVARYVSTAAGIAAAGAFLFPLGIVWTHVWGMENSLYGLLLVGTAAWYQGRLLPTGGLREAAVLGALLGATTLARLNAGILVPTLLLFYLLGRGHGSARRRLAAALVTGLVSSLVVAPYLAWNLVHTGHLVPVTAAVKQMRTTAFMAERGVERAVSLEYLGAVADRAKGPMRWFVGSRALDGSWIAGGRALAGEGKGSYGLVLALLLGFLSAPFATLRWRDWLAALGRMLSRLAPFGWLAAFALFDGVVSLLMFPAEITYPMVRWWLLESEVVIIVTMAVVAATALDFLVRSWVPSRHRLRVASLWLAAIVSISAGRAVAFYWDGVVEYPDWNVSTNDERYAAAIWMRENLPADAVIGSWNAGVLGYYSGRRVVNLDGLVNSWDFVPYLRRGALPAYVVGERIEYLADTDFELSYRTGSRLRRRLRLTEVYRHYMDGAGTGLNYRDQPFRIFRVDGPRRRRRGRGPASDSGSAEEPQSRG